MPVTMPVPSGSPCSLKVKWALPVVPALVEPVPVEPVPVEPVPVEPVGPSPVDPVDPPVLPLVDESDDDGV
jgi:hypothetical protein